MEDLRQKTQDKRQETGSTGSPTEGSGQAKQETVLGYARTDNTDAQDDSEEKEVSHGN